MVESSGGDRDRNSAARDGAERAAGRRGRDGQERKIARKKTHKHS
jgi:hypothetical protein